MRLHALISENNHEASLRQHRHDVNNMREEALTRFLPYDIIS
jgi:hypothetical protein